MPANLGTKTGFSGIPSLLISDLGSVEDPNVQRALYQIQNWANSVGLVNGTTGAGTASLGTNSPATNLAAPTLWTTVSINGTPAYIPVWT